MTNRSRQRKIHNETGMTLIEIMVVMVILGILAGLVIPRIMGRPEEARRVKAMVQMKNIEAALKLYKLDTGNYPSIEQSLDALVEKPTVGIIPLKWNESGYLDKVPLDPWGNPYLYLSPGQHGDYDLVSYGSDGVEGGEGKDADLESWNL